MANQPQAETRVTFENVAVSAGLTFTHANGASAQKYLVETMGSGAVSFDYDSDGWTDLFFVDGGSLVVSAVASRARHRLFHNEGNGSFKEITAASGIPASVFADSIDLDNVPLTCTSISGIR